VALLARLTALESLELYDVKMCDREAMAPCLTGLGPLTRLNELMLCHNALTAQLFTVLAVTARSLPLLNMVHVAGEGVDDANGIQDAALQETWDFLAGRPIFVFG
jgi:hypothetical protein